MSEAGDPVDHLSGIADAHDVKQELAKKVDNVSGKQLSTEDFTTALKQKLQSLNNYDDSALTSAINSLQNQINTLVSGNASSAIDTFNEIISFLNGVKDTQDLAGIIASIEQQIASVNNSLSAELAKKPNKTELATINGQSLTNGGNIVIEGKNYDAELAEQEQKLTELSSEIYYEEQHLAASDAGYWTDNDTPSFRADANASYVKEKVIEGQVCRVQGMASSTIAAYVLIDKSGKAIDKKRLAAIEVFDIEVTIPSGAAAIIVNSYKYTPAYIPAVASVRYGVKQKIELLHDDVDASVQHLQDGVLSRIYEPTRGGYWNDNTLTLQTDANSSYIKAEVKAGQKWHIKGMASTAVAAYIFLDKEGNKLSSQRLTAIEVFDLELAVPIGAATIIVNSYKYTASYREAAAEVVNDLPANISTLLTEVDALKNQSAGSVLKGKKILCLGDSITEMKGYGDTANLRYSDIITQLTGAETINGGIGGTHYALREAPTSTPTTSNSAYANLDLPSITEALATKDWSKQYASVRYIEDNNLATVGGAGSTRRIIDQLAEVDLANIDIVTILIGTNDMYDATLGAKGDTTPILSKYGAFRKVCKDLLSANPNLRIYYFSPIPRYMGGNSWAAFDSETIANNAAWSDNYKNGAGISFVSLVDACLDAAKECKIPSCDMYRTMGINEWNFKSIMMPEDVRYDGTHPFRGLRQIANRMVAFIESHNNLNL